MIKKIVLTQLIFFVVIGGILFVILKNYETKEMQTSTHSLEQIDEDDVSATTIAAPFLHLELSRLLDMQSDAMVSAAKDAYMNTDSFTYSRDAATASNTKIADLLTTLYAGEELENFHTLFDKQLDRYLDYAQNLQQKPAPTEDTFLSEDAFLSLFPSAEDHPEITDAVTKNNKLLTQIITAYAEKDYVTSLQYEEELRTNTLYLAEIITTDLVAMKPDKFTGDIENPSVDFEIQLTSLLHRDITLHFNYLKSIAQKETTKQQAKKESITQNTYAIAEMLADAYDTEAQELFENLWTTRTELFEKYALAQNDTQKEEYAIQSETHTLLISKFFLSYNTLLPEEGITPILSQDWSNTHAAIDAIKKNDFTTFYTKRDDGYQNINNLARLIVQNITLDTETAPSPIVTD